MRAQSYQVSLLVEYTKRPRRLTRKPQIYYPLRYVQIYVSTKTGENLSLATGLHATSPSAQATPPPPLFCIILMPPSFELIPLKPHPLIAFPFHNNSTIPPYAKIEKKAAMPRHQPNPTRAIQSGTKNGSVRLKDNRNRPIIAALSLAWPLKHSIT